LFSITICFAQKSSKELQEFAQDLSSANIKLRGDLMLFGQFKDNLSTLTYEDYLVLIKKSEKKSNKNITKTIKKADGHYFTTTTSTFYIVIYCKEFNAIIYDDANTAFIDSVKVLNATDGVPDLKSFVNK
jgi:hypothetical protein